MKRGYEQSSDESSDSSVASSVYDPSYTNEFDYELIIAYSRLTRTTILA